MPQLVSIPIERLLDSDSDVQSDIATAFGEDGLGILTVSGIKGYVEARQRLLRLAPQLAGLSESCLKQYEDPESTYSVGWSCGKESLQNGKKDTFKGSFYANPLVDEPCSDPCLVRQHPSYLRPNLWPTAHLPELEPAFKQLGRMVVDTGLLLMTQCDRYVSSLNPSFQPGHLHRVLSSSVTHKARLLHYFPPDSRGTAAAEDNDIPHPQDQAEEWCGWHTDHGSLTGLTCAMYFEAGRQVAAPSPEAGLYIKNRAGEVVKASIPEDHIAFQVGESLQIHSGGLLRATPHYVRTAPAAGGYGHSSSISRNTFAVFLQPSLSEPLSCPAGADPCRVDVGQWKPGMNFGQFAEATFKKYYQPA